MNFESNTNVLNICTLFDQRYLLQGITMINSVERYASVKIRWTVLALDKITVDFLTSAKHINLEILTLDSINDSELKALENTRPWGQLCWTSAACLLRFVNSKLRKGQIAAYIDADCLFFYDISKTLNPLTTGGSIAIHEHRYSPDRAEWLQRSGRFNVGLVAGVNGTEFDSCIDRWRMQVLESCDVDESSGKCGDQTYLNEWPKLYTNLVILSEKGVAIAPWNLNNYKISQKEDQFYVDDSPLHFFHFHALEIGWVSNSFQLFIPAAGYKLNWKEVNPVYEKYMSELGNTTRTKTVKWSHFRKPRIIWWIKALGRKNLVLVFENKKIKIVWRLNENKLKRVKNVR